MKSLFRKKFFIFWILLLASVGMSIFYFQEKAKERPVSQDFSQDFKEEDFELIQGLKKRKAISFRLPNLSGFEESLEDYLGRYVVLNFWATWCGPCITEIPSMIKLKNHFKNKDIVLIGVSIDKRKDLEKVKKYVDHMKIDYPILLDFDGNVAEKYLVYAIPATFILDKEGFILGKKIGGWDWYSKSTIRFFDNLLNG